MHEYCFASLLLSFIKFCVPIAKITTKAWAHRLVNMLSSDIVSVV